MRRFFFFSRIVFKITQVALLFFDFLVMIVQLSFALPSLAVFHFLFSFRFRVV